VRFNQSVYSVNENEGPVQATLVLSSSSPTDFRVQVRDIEGAANS